MCGSYFLIFAPKEGLEPLEILFSSVLPVSQRPLPVNFVVLVEQLADLPACKCPMTATLSLLSYKAASLD